MRYANAELFLVTNERRWFTVQFHRWSRPHIYQNQFPDTTTGRMGGIGLNISLGFVTLAFILFCE